jgi:diaminopimelate dehydrogenase
MSDRIRLGIFGYGNLGRGVEAAVGRQPDLELVGIFTRRDPGSLTPSDGDVPVHHVDEADDLVDAIDVMVACGGSKDDLPAQVPDLVTRFCVVDSYDTHAKIGEYFATVDAAARAAGTLAIISTGWDPGLFSLNRLFGEAILPEGQTATFWGRGVSQGHSDAIRRIPGVAAGVQYTEPVPAAIDAVRSGSRPELTPGTSHTRACFVVLDEGADPDEVHAAIVGMPDYFAPYATTVTFVTAEELAREHGAMPHGGVVIRSGTTADGADHTIEYRLGLGHNPSFTASVLVAYARAAHRLAGRGEIGARTVFDVAPGLLSPRRPDELRRDLL